VFQTRLKSCFALRLSSLHCIEHQILCPGMMTADCWPHPRPTLRGPWPAAAILCAHACCSQQPSTVGCCCSMLQYASGKLLGCFMHDICLIVLAPTLAPRHCSMHTLVDSCVNPLIMELLCASRLDLQAAASSSYIGGGYQLY
jgi:hypothetical protein